MIAMLALTALVAGQQATQPRPANRGHPGGQPRRSAVLGLSADVFHTKTACSSSKSGRVPGAAREVETIRKQKQLEN
jgi:hypothetical protein